MPTIANINVASNAPHSKTLRFTVKIMVAS
jgi:hypothetical protein